ncbi:hypothetical protein [Limnobacter sp. P1]|uniref:hypothetical protein n=1 Tax=Limnobacter olei TaxID=3031298 RepID=UPI0023B055F6|nr:hypothetical protein [Limnobacter sp. P1]
MLRAEWSKDVLQVVEQPMLVAINVDGKQYDYVPDFATLDSSHSIDIWEVKPPHWDQSPRLVRKYRSAKIELAKQGFNFEVVTNENLCSPELLGNLRFFYPQISNVPSSEVLRVENALRSCGGAATVAEILRHDSACSFSAICAVAWEFWSDIHHESFNAQSLLSLGAQK